MNFLRMSIITLVACVTLAIADADAATLKLRWDAPTHRANCQPLSRKEIARYHIEYKGPRSGYKYPKGGTFGYALTVSDGQYSLRIRVQDTAGLWSDFDQWIYVSAVGDKVIQLPSVPASKSVCA